MSFVQVVTALVTVAQNVVPATFDGAPDHIPALPSNYAVIGSAVAAATSAGQPTEFYIGAQTLSGVLLPDSGWIVAAGFDYTQTSDEDLNDPDVTTRFAHIDFRFTVSHLLQLS
jgi:hypothetical protein